MESERSLEELRQRNDELTQDLQNANSIPRAASFTGCCTCNCHADKDLVIGTWFAAAGQASREHLGARGLTQTGAVIARLREIMCEM
jgi:hypothetical protein